jgi:glycosyltransferase involved in cell wall biosynthesis
MLQTIQSTERTAPPPSPLGDKRLGIICSVPATRTANNQLLINHAVGRLLDAIMQRVPNSRLCVPLVDEPSSSRTHPLAVDIDCVTPLPPLASVVGSQRYHFQTCRAIRRFAASVDVLFMRVPYQVPTALRRLGKPKLMHVISNPREVIDASNDYRGPIKWLAQQFASHSVATMRRMAAEPHTRVASNGQQMYDVLSARAGRVVVSSCLWEREMRPRTDLRLNDPPRILFVGFLRPEKGIHTLLDAFEKIRARRPVKLTLVGGADKVVTRTEAEVKLRVAHSRFRDDIEQRGVVEFGETLFDLYRSHDLYVLPSLSEGTPRTLVEARSFGCPVIATRVGGIPSSVEHGQDGWLIEANNSEALIQAIERVLDDEPLRRRMIEQGLARAKRHTLERFADELVEELAIAAREGLSA